MAKQPPPGQNQYPIRIFALIGMCFMMFILLTLQASTKKVTPIEFEKYIVANKISDLVFRDRSIEGLASFNGKAVKVITYPATEEERDELRKLAKEKGIGYTGTLDTGWVSQILSSIIWIALFFGIWWYLFLKPQQKQAGGLFGFGQSKAKRYQAGKDRKTFADVAGCDEAKEELQEIVEFLKNPKDFTKLGAKVPKGVLLYGKPGTGKTLLAQAVAGEAGVAFLTKSGSGFVEMFVGVGASRVRDLFDQARKLAPCILFIDEIDAVGKKRALGGVSSSHDEHGQTLDQFLAEIDGFNKDTGVIVMAATNRPDVLDEALVRPGRFDRQIYVPIPDVRGREQILKIHTRTIKLASDIDLLTIAKDTAGMAGADLENVVNEATLFATRRKKDFVEQSDFSDAVDRVTMGLARKSVKLSDEEKRKVAYHEAGHALVAKLTKHTDPVHRVTIIPRGPALGFMKQLPEDRNLHTKSQLEAVVAVLVGGRIAEKLIFGEITTGSLNDFERATGIVKKMVYELGMSEAGLAVYKERNDFWGVSIGSDASQKTKEKLEKIVEITLSNIYNSVEEKLKNNQNKLNALAEELLEKETLDGKEVDKIVDSA